MKGILSATWKPCFHLSFVTQRKAALLFIEYTLFPFFSPALMQAAKQPDIQQGSRALNTLWGLRAVGWTTCAVFTWLSRARLRKTGMLKPNRCMIQRRELWRVNFLYKSMLLLEQSSSLEPSQEAFICVVTFFCSGSKMHFLALHKVFESSEEFSLSFSHLNSSSNVKYQSAGQSKEKKWSYDWMCIYVTRDSVSA